MTSHPNGERGHQICDKLWQGGVSSFVMSHELFWYACYTQSYQKGRVWRPMFLFHLQWFSVATNEEIFVDIANGLIVFVVYFR